MNGSFINSITTGGFWWGIGPDPINPGLGNVYNWTDTFPPATSWNLFAQIYPWSANANAGIDVSTANGFVFGGLVTNVSVPEPSSLVLCGIASVAGAAGMRYRRRIRAIKTPSLPLHKQ